MINQATVYFRLGRYFLDDGSYELAINALTRAIELDSNNALAYDLRGIARAIGYQYDESITDFNQAIAIDPAFAGAYNNRGLSFYKIEMFDEASL